MKIIGLVAALALPAAPLAAQVAEGDQVDADEDGTIVLIEPGPQDIIVVEGGNLSKPLAERVVPITYIYDPDQSAGQRVENIIRNIPGWQQFRRSDARSANPTSQGLTSRGLGGNASSRALLTLDGVPQTDPFGGWVNWTAFDAVRLRGVRVESGGGSGVEGAGALAGTIQLSSDRWPQQRGSIAYGSRNSVDLDVSTGANLGEGHLMLSGNYSRGDGFEPIVASQRGAVDGAAGYESFGAGLRIVVPLTGWGNGPSLEANFRGFDDRRSRGLPFSDNRNSGVDASIRVIKNDSSVDWLALAYVQLREFSSQFNSVAVDRSSVTPTLDQYAVPATGLGARFELRPEIGTASRSSGFRNQQLRLGVDWRRTIGTTRENSNFVAGLPTRSREAGGVTDTLGGYAEWTGLFGDINLTASTRMDYWSLTDGRRYEFNIGGTVRSDDRFAARQGWEPTARVAAKWIATDFFSINAAAYTGWRLPTLNELYRPFRVGADAIAANETLEPERLKGAEIKLQSDAGKFGMIATAFYSRLDGAIANLTQGAGPGNFPGVGFVAAGGVYRRRENLEAIDSKGFELEADLNLKPFLLKASYAYVDARVASSGIAAPLNGLRPAQVPSHFASAAVEYHGPTMDADISLRYVGAQFEDDLNNQRLSDAVTLDAGLSYQLREGLLITLRGENILDAEVQAAISSSGIIERAAPRTIWFGISFTKL